MTTCTRMPRSCSRRTISADLYAAMPPDTPSAIFIADLPRIARPLRQPHGRLSGPLFQAWRGFLRVFREGFAQGLAGRLDRKFWQFWNQPFHFARLDFILRDAAGLARNRFDHGRRATLQLPGPPCRYQNVAVVAVKSFDQLHRFSPT